MHGRDALGGLSDGRGRVRSAWRPVIAAMQAIGPAEFAARAAALDRRARFETSRPGASLHRLDPIPFPLMEEEFAPLAQAVSARATFLASALDDLYGEQGWLRDFRLPAEPVFSSPDFVRQLASPDRLAAPRLGLYAVDLVREPDGGFRVLADHTDTAPDLGIALAIRRFTAEIVPELFGAVTLTSQRPLVETLQDMLHGLAQGGPIGLLATGRADTADAALLARQLGGTVLRPDDLSCSGGRLSLRTLEGATPVHLLLRLGTAQGIDPLEQGGPPAQGIPGLFRCLRAGTAVMLNAPGSGVAGDAALAAPLASLFAGRGGKPPVLAHLDGADTIPASQAPCAARGGADGPPHDFEPAHITLRLYAAQIDGRWQVLPGGIAHARRADGGTVLKDIWVIEQGHDGALVPGPAQRFAPPPAHRAVRALPSRLADDLLWLGRITERLDATARLLGLTLPRFADASGLPHEVAQRTLLARCLVAASLLPSEAMGPFLSARMLNEALARARPVNHLCREVARLLDACGERFSAPMRETVDTAFELVGGGRIGEIPSLPACRRFVATFNGLIAEDASHSGAFLFVEIGRRLERAESMAEALAILLAAPAARLDPGLSLGIELADATLTYEFIHAAPITPAPAIALLLASRDYPRSLAFQTEALTAAFERIGASEAAETARAITARLSETAGSVETIGPALGATALGPVLQHVAADIRALAARLDARYFAPVPPAHQMEEPA